MDGFIDIPCFECQDVYEPVCGENGETYSNSCYASNDEVDVLCQVI